MRNLLATALVAGFLAGLAVFAVHLISAVPLIEAAEVFEEAAAAAEQPNPGTPPHDHAAWEPEAGFERHAYTALADVVTGTGFALLLVGLFALRNRPTDLRQGLAWGAAGFAVFALAPSLGLPPELPGSPAAELGLRQLWWLATVGATAGGLALLVFAKLGWLKGIGVLLLLLPHAIGAPHPGETESALPPALVTQFVAASLIGSAVFWAVLGAASGWLYGRLR
jgi:cobalt transporter subunit CbtA